MFRRLKTTSLAGSGALFLVLIVSGAVAAASVLTVIVAPTADPEEPAVVDTSQTWEDLDGDGVDDDCDEAVEEDAEAAVAADLAVDLNADGTISVSEAAQSDRLGGTNCNHGGYVSNVAQESCDEATEPDGDDGTEEGAEDGAETTETTAEETADCTETEAEEPAEEIAEEETPTECEAAPEEPAEEPVEEPTTDEPVDVAPNAHGKAVSDVARSDAVGGKNCNHGGAVSEKAHEDKADREAAREAAKEAREAARDAKKATKGGKGNGHGH